MITLQERAGGSSSSGASVPVGSGMEYWGTTEPSGWLFCYGQAISRTTYADLFAVISTTYGVGDGTTTFNLPDVRGRVVAGQDDMGGSSANRLTGLTGGVNGDTLGGTGGAESHALDASEIPNNNVSGTTSGGTNRATSSHTGTASSAHNNVQPTIIANYMIYTGVV